MGVLLFLSAGIWAWWEYLGERQTQTTGGKEGHFEMVEVEALPSVEVPFPPPESQQKAPRHERTMPTPVFLPSMHQEKNEKSG